MTLPRFDLLVPSTLEETCQMLRDHQEDGVRILAGGTDILVDLKQPIVQRELHPAGLNESGANLLSTISDEAWSSPDPLSSDSKTATLVSLHKLDSLKEIETLNDGRLKVGALVTARNLQRDSRVREKWSALAEGADSLGSPLVRARGTLAGNICNARPAADMAIPSLCLGAELVVLSTHGERFLPLDGFFLSPGKTILAEDELVIAVTFPKSETGFGSAYYKLAQRKALDISVVGVAAALQIESDGVISSASIALGAVGPTPMNAKSAESLLSGKMATEENFILAAKAAESDASPIDDHRGGAEYRNQMVETLTLRMLIEAAERSGRQS